MITQISNKDIAEDHYRDIRKRPLLACEVPEPQIVGGWMKYPCLLALLFPVPVIDHSPNRDGILA